MTGLLSVIAWGNRLHNYSGSLTGPENTLSENTLGRNNLMKSWEDQALTVWCVPRNSQFSDLFNYIISMMGHYIGEVDDSDVTFSSPHDLGGGKIGMSSRGSSGVTEQLILRSQWTTPSMLLPMVGWAHPILVVSAQFDEVYLLSAHWAAQVLRDHRDQKALDNEQEPLCWMLQCAKCVERKGTLTTSWDTLRKTISLGWLKPAISVERTPGPKTVWGSTGNKQIISSKTILRTRDGLRKHLALTSTPTNCDWAQAPGTGLEFSRKKQQISDWLNSYNLRAALWELVTACNLNIPVEAFTEEYLT